LVFSFVLIFFIHKKDLLSRNKKWKQFNLWFADFFPMMIQQLKKLWLTENPTPFPVEIASR
jgi:hypothetical protein